jgi:hypothetical protein
MCRGYFLRSHERGASHLPRSIAKQTKTDRSKMQKIRLVLFYAWNYNTRCARVYKLPTSNYYYYFLFSSVFLFLILIFFLRHRFLFTVIII